MDWDNPRDWAFIFISNEEYFNLINRFKFEKVSLPRAVKNLNKFLAGKKGYNAGKFDAPNLMYQTNKVAWCNNSRYFRTADNKTFLIGSAYETNLDFCKTVANYHELQVAVSPIGNKYYIAYYMDDSNVDYFKEHVNNAYEFL